MFQKTERVFFFVLTAFILILFRVWHLGVVQREEKIKLSEIPKRRAIVQKAYRGSVTDRFGIPLAVNKICYQAVLYYDQIASLPGVAWKTDDTGKRIRYFPRREYIQELSKNLSTLLQLHPQKTEDLIHSKASLFPHAPFLLKTHLTEEEYYKLAALEKDWPGIHAEVSSERFYPRGKAGGGVIGAMGFISSKEYRQIADEMQTLQKVIEEWEMGQGVGLPAPFSSLEEVVRRFQELKEKSYTLQDLVGKTGIEAAFEAQLRGFYGKLFSEVDQKGRFLKEVPGSRKAMAGQDLQLSLSIELQEFAESLLVQDEGYRTGKSIGMDPITKERKPLKQPWVKGGGIVALDPNTGEVLALATMPRFDPNDFIPSSEVSLQKVKQERVCRWLENERSIGAIWDGKENLSRERYEISKGFYEESKPLTWDLYLELLLPSDGPFIQFFRVVDTVKSAIQVQEDLEALLYYAGYRDAVPLMQHWNLETFQDKGEAAIAAFHRLDSLLSPFSFPADRLFAIDLCRLVVHAPAFNDASIRVLGSMTLSAYRALNQSICKLEADLKEKAFLRFHEGSFQAWRTENQKQWLASLRAREKELKSAPRPYIEYLDRKEKELFELHWQEERLQTLAAQNIPALAGFSLEDRKAVLHTFRSFSGLERPLLTLYPHISKTQGEQMEKNLATAFYPRGGFGYLRSYAYQAPAVPGSIFKLVTAYAALMQTKGANPLTIVDGWQYGGNSVATTCTGIPIPRIYKGGRLPKSHTGTLGTVDLVGALEQSSNPYFALLAVDLLQDPNQLLTIASAFNFGAPTQIQLPQEATGKLPQDLATNQTGLYSTAIGQHTLLATPLQASILFAAIANGGHIVKPSVTHRLTGAEPKREALACFEQREGLASDELRCLGIPFPLFTGALTAPAYEIRANSTSSPLRTLSMPPNVRSLLLEGMDRAVWGPKGSARPAAIKALASHPLLLADYIKLQHQMVGKTSTAEVLFNPNRHPSSSSLMYKHIWFGAIAFDETTPRRERPELVVIVYLRYGEGGKEAAPLAAQIIHKWRSLRAAHRRP